MKVDIEIVKRRGTKFSDLALGDTFAFKQDDPVRLRVKTGDNAEVHLFGVRGAPGFVRADASVYRVAYFKAVLEE